MQCMVQPRRQLTREHAYCDTGAVALGNGGGDLGSEGVLDPHQGYEGEILLYLLGCVLLPAPLLTLCTALEGHKDIPISNGKRPAQQHKEISEVTRLHKPIATGGGLNIFATYLRVLLQASCSGHDSLASRKLINQARKQNTNHVTLKAGLMYLLPNVEEDQVRIASSETRHTCGQLRQCSNTKQLRPFCTVTYNMLCSRKCTVKLLTGCHPG